MYSIVNNVIIDESVYKFCIEYVENHSHNRSYDNERLFEYYPPKEKIITNLDIKGISIGKMPTGNISMHIDDDRNSCLVIPISPKELTIIDSNSKLTLSSPFIVDTSELHSARGIEGVLFLTLDFHKSFQSTKEYLESIIISSIRVVMND
jgi:hypothetical protein